MSIKDIAFFKEAYEKGKSEKKYESLKSVFNRQLSKKLDKVTAEPTHAKEIKLKSIARMDASGTIYVDPKLNVAGVCNRESSTYNKKNKASDGLRLSSRAARKIKQRISAYHVYLEENKRKLLWCTFTVPPFRTGRKFSPKKDDPVIYQAFRLYIKNLKVNYGLQDYIYVAERQTGKRNVMRGVEKEKTNAIHFHAILIFENGKYLDYSKLNALWCHQLQKCDCQIVAEKWEDIYKKQSESEKWLTEQMKTYYNETLVVARQEGLVDVYLNDHLKDLKRIQKSNSFNGIPVYELGSEFKKYLRNPFQQEEIYDMKKLRVYLAKYITKNCKAQNEDDEILYCRPYSASKGFASVDPMIEIPDKDVVHLLTKEPHKIYKKYTHDFEIGDVKFTSTRIILKEETLKDNPHYQELKSYISMQFETLGEMDGRFDEWDQERKMHAYAYAHNMKRKDISAMVSVPVFTEDFDYKDNWKELCKEFEKEIIKTDDLVDNNQVDYLDTCYMLDLRP